MEVDEQVVRVLEDRIEALKAENASMQAASKRQNGPRRLILIRHGESEGNVDQEIYKTKADNALHLTNAGWKQAIGAGARLKEVIGDESVYFIVSPYVRTRETFNGLAKSFGGFDAQNWREDPRLREQVSRSHICATLILSVRILATFKIRR
jgi:hypothetical protein